MPLLSPISVSGRPWGAKSRLLITLVQVGSLLATAGMVWWAALVPRLNRQGLLSVLAEVVGYTLLAWFWSAAVALTLYAFVPIQDRSDMMPDVMRTAATAVWFGPAMILLSNFSLLSLAPALVLVVYASRLLYAQWLPKMSVAAPVYVAREAGSFADCQLPRAFVWRERLPAIAVAMCLEAGAIAVAMRYPLLGAALFCTGTALLTVFSMATGAANAGRPPTLPKSIVGILATVVLASLLTLGRGGSGAGWFGTGSASGGPHPGVVESARAVLRELFYGEIPGRNRGTGPDGAKRPETANTGASGGFPGVILWPEIRPTFTLIAPMPELGSNPFQGRAAQPLSIPFDGAYWLFRWPFAHPPASSDFERGNPVKFGFSTTDHRPLQMEAHQKLETAIDLRCCRAIDIEIRNADRYAESLTLELVVLNAAHTFPMLESLGFAPVTSLPDERQGSVLPVGETLSFAVPVHPPMAQFNEFRVIFHRTQLRSDKSARVSLERFILRPR